MKKINIEYKDINWDKLWKGSWKNGESIIEFPNCYHSIFDTLNDSEHSLRLDGHIIWNKENKPNLKEKGWVLYLSEDKYYNYETAKEIVQKNIFNELKKIEKELNKVIK